jgi:curved DNA-binding protein CbpA
MKLTLLVLPILFIVINSVASAQHYQSFSCVPDESVNYEWEKWNHYELLGFPKTQSLNKIDSAMIKKAYRKRAQQWHPDKVKASETLPMDEINARFARLGDAYRTLSDEESRKAYNRFLKDCDMTKRRRASSPRNDKESDDPLGNSYNNNQRQRGRTKPTSVQKQQEMLVNPMTGASIMRETTYEEFYSENYFRVTIQDYDAWGQPLHRHPKIVEEGQIHPPSSSGQQGHNKKSNWHQRTTQDTLEEGGVLRANQSLYSSNGQHRAYLRRCQLVIETKQETEFGPEIVIVWTSPNEVPRTGRYTKNAECFLALEIGQLMIAEGSPEFHNGQILWFSSDEDDERFEFGPNTSYRARLEDDGVLVVYRFVRFDGKEEETCIYATGLFGCLRLGKYILQGAHLVKNTVAFAAETLRQKYNEGILSKKVNLVKKKLAILLVRIQAICSELEAGDWEEILSRLYQVARRERERFSSAFNHYSKIVFKKAKLTALKLNKSRKRAERRIRKRTLRLVRDGMAWWVEFQRESERLKRARDGRA